MIGPVVVDVATELLARYPRLGDAVQPARLEPQGPAIDPARNAKLFRFDDRWRRRIVFGPPGLVGPIAMTGDCLAPHFGERVIGWFDPGMMPTDGDLVLVRRSDNDMRQMLDDGAKANGWLEQYNGVQIGNVLLKQLQVRDGHYFLVAVDGTLAFGESKVLGVLRYYMDEHTMPAALFQMLMKQ